MKVVKARLGIAASVMMTLAVATLASCDSRSPIFGVRQQFSDDNVCFQYPHGWVVDHEDVRKKNDSGVEEVFPRYTVTTQSESKLEIVLFPETAKGADAELHELLTGARTKALLKSGLGGQVKQEKYGPWTVSVASSESTGLIQDSVILRGGIELNLRLCAVYVSLGGRKTLLSVAMQQQDRSTDEGAFSRVIESLGAGPCRDSANLQ